MCSEKWLVLPRWNFLKKLKEGDYVLQVKHDVFPVQAHAWLSVYTGGGIGFRSIHHHQCTDSGANEMEVFSYNLLVQNISNKFLAMNDGPQKGRQIFRDINGLLRMGFAKYRPVHESDAEMHILWNSVMLEFNRLKTCPVKPAKDKLLAEKVTNLWRVCHDSIKGNTCNGKLVDESSSSSKQSRQLKRKGTPVRDLPMTRMRAKLIINKMD